MNGKDIFDGLEFLDTKYIEQAEFGTFSREAFEKDEKIKRIQFRRATLLAAVIAAAVLMLGCAVTYTLYMQDLNVGQTQFYGETESRQVLTFSGIQGSASFKAAQEWLHFSQSFDPEKEIWRNRDEHGVIDPAEYAAYESIWCQEQADELEVIAEKYGLTLAGKQVKARSPKSLFAYLNIGSPLLPDAPAAISNTTVKYYENGLFYADFYLLPDGEDEDIFCLYYYTPKNCFDAHFVYIAENEDWREWNYTTAAGDNVLILRSDSLGAAYAFRDMEEATAAAKIYTDTFDKSMTDAQLQQAVDLINFDLKPQPGDPALLDGFGAGIDTAAREQTSGDYTIRVKDVQTDGERAFVTLTITAPEDVTLEGMSIHPGNRGEGLMIPKSGGEFDPVTVNWNSTEGKDGLKNTAELVVSVDTHTCNAMGFVPGEDWSLYIEGLDITQPNSMLEKELGAHVEGVWQFDISFDDGDYREIEFIGEPVTVPVRSGEGEREATLVSLRLRKYSGFADFGDMAGSLTDFENNRQVKAVLKDGSEILLIHIGGFGLKTKLQPEAEEIPLEEVEYILLPDGRMLYPQS